MAVVTRIRSVFFKRTKNAIEEEGLLLESIIDGSKVIIPLDLKKKPVYNVFSERESSKININFGQFSIDINRASRELDKE